MLLRTTLSVSPYALLHVEGLPLLKIFFDLLMKVSCTEGKIQVNIK